MTTTRPRILAIDPGTRFLGYAVLEGEDLLYHGVKVLPKGLKNGETVRAVQRVGNEIIDHLKPSVLAIEVSFRGKSRRMATQVAVLNALAFLGKRRRLKTISFTPAAVRKHLCGMGGATKRDVAFMITFRYPELRSYIVRERRWKERFHSHMFDAIAVGLKALDDITSTK